MSAVLKQQPSEFRYAEHSDIDYLIGAAKAFIPHTPYSFDEGSYTMVAHSLIKDPDSIFIVRGRPAECHCVAKLVSSIYNRDEVIARVVSTWGPGGLKCFDEVERLAYINGAKFIMADLLVEPRMESFYRRLGMTKADTLYFKELGYGS
ncbi:MAG: hypothetical protein GY927_10955 [bacterium]|nr:hypothetical protein [bacterium]